MTEPNKTAILPIKTKVPRWANWVAQDANGTWWAFRDVPEKGEGVWLNPGTAKIERLGTISARVFGDWVKTLQATQ